MKNRWKRGCLNKEDRKTLKVKKIEGAKQKNEARSEEEIFFIQSNRTTSKEMVYKEKRHENSLKTNQADTNYKSN